MKIVSNDEGVETSNSLIIPTDSENKEKDIQNNKIPIFEAQRVTGICKRI